MLRLSIDHLDDLVFFKIDKFWFHQVTVLGIWKVEFWGDWLVRAVDNNCS